MRKPTFFILLSMLLALFFFPSCSTTEEEDVSNVYGFVFDQAFVPYSGNWKKSSYLDLSGNPTGVGYIYYNTKGFFLYPEAKAETVDVVFIVNPKSISIQLGKDGRQLSLFTGPSRVMLYDGVGMKMLGTAVIDPTVDRMVMDNPDKLIELMLSQKKVGLCAEVFFGENDWVCFEIDTSGFAYAYYDAYGYLE